MSGLTDLPNISKVIAADLEKSGISTSESLKSLGSTDAFIRIRACTDPNACINCALWKARFKAFAGISYRTKPSPT
jgi:TfoX C-terminal domain.